MATENVVHIRFDYDESVRAKRAILFSEMSSLKIAKTIGKYKSLRLAELDMKNKVYSKMKETKASIRKLQDLLPEPRVPRILKRLQREEAQVLGIKEIKPAKQPEASDIESQLREIQRRLDSLSG